MEPFQVALAAAAAGAAAIAAFVNDVQQTQSKSSKPASDADATVPQKSEPVAASVFQPPEPEPKEKLVPTPEPAPEDDLTKKFSAELQSRREKLESTPAPTEPPDEELSKDFIKQLVDLEEELLKFAREALKQARVAETYAIMNRRMADIAGDDVAEEEEARSEASASAATAAFLAGRAEAEVVQTKDKIQAVVTSINSARVTEECKKAASTLAQGAEELTRVANAAKVKAAEEVVTIRADTAEAEAAAATDEATTTTMAATL